MYLPLSAALQRQQGSKTIQETKHAHTDQSLQFQLAEEVNEKKGVFLRDIFVLRWKEAAFEQEKPNHGRIGGEVK